MYPAFSSKPLIPHIDPLHCVSEKTNALTSLIPHIDPLHCVSEKTNALTSDINSFDNTYIENGQQRRYKTDEIRPKITQEEGDAWTNNQEGSGNVLSRPLPTNENLEFLKEEIKKQLINPDNMKIFQSWFSSQKKRNKNTCKGTKSQSKKKKKTTPTKSSKGKVTKVKNKQTKSKSKVKSGGKNTQSKKKSSTKKKK